jgi:predicted DNA-binding protein YlxM (UPF0122 family)
MNQVEFDYYFEQLTPKQKEVLKLFLQNKSDKEIAQELRSRDGQSVSGSIDDYHTGITANVRKHIANICDKFHLRESQGERCRDDLIHLFIDFKPDWVCPELIKRFRGRSVEFENPEGPVPLGSKFYAERPPLESDAYQEISQPGALLRIKAPGQMGKSSLINRIRDYAMQQGYRSVSLNFRSASIDDFASIDQFLYWFCAVIADELELEDELDAYWKSSTTASNRKCTKYFKHSLLRKNEKQEEKGEQREEDNTTLLLCLDNVDRIFQYQKIAEDFFGLLRSWHEQSKAGGPDKDWTKLRMVISYTKEVYVPLKINCSPFNVGIQITVPPFESAQVADLALRHRLYWSDKELQQVMEFLGGHPYLVRMALFRLARQEIELAGFLNSAATEAGLYSEYLKDLLLSLRDNPALVETMRQIVASPTPIRIDTELGFKLTSLGVVRHVGNGTQVFCELYRTYFRDRLGAKG